MQRFRLAHWSGVLVAFACANQSPLAANGSGAPPAASARRGDDDATGAAKAPTATASSDGSGVTGNPSSQAGTHMQITVGSTVFTATLVENETATAFKAMLPLTVNMTELNANEKYYHFARDLPANASNPGTIHAGDVMLYGSSSLSYTYTRIGRVDDASGLAAALGPRNVTVTFAL
jgi:hypothetical protein